MPSVCVAGTDLGSEDGLTSLRDHVQLLDGGGQITGCSQVSQTYEAALSPNIIMGPVVPLVRGVRGWRKNNRGMFRVHDSSSVPGGTFALWYFQKKIMYINQ